MTTVNGKLIGAGNPARVEMKATLVDVTGKPTVGYVASVPGEVVKDTAILAGSDGAWQVTLTANTLITSDAGDTLWAIQEGRRKDGSPILTYILVPATGGPFWLGDLRVDLSGTITGGGTVVYVPGPQGDPGPAGTAGTPGSPGASGPSAYQVAQTEGFIGTEAEWLASLVGPQGDAGPQPALGAAGAGPAIALRSDDPTTADARTPTAHKTSHATGGTDALAPADIGAEPSGTASAAVTTHAGTADAHGDRAWADNKFATTLTVTALNTYVDDTVNRIADVENGTAWLAGLNINGSAQVVNGDLTVADAAKGYRFRRGGSALDLEATGADLITSVWSGTGFNGTQHSFDRYASNADVAQHAGRREYVTGLYGAPVHAIDAATGVAELGAKNGLTNLHFCGRLTTIGAPTTGDWTAGDTAQDAAGTWWLCTTAGTPGTWLGGKASSPWRFDITDYGAKGNAVVVHDGQVTLGDTTLTCATSAPFSASLVGKPVLIQGAGTFGVTAFKSTLATYNGPDSMELADAPPTSISNAVVVFGSNSYTAIRAATAAAEAYLAAGHTYAEVYSPPGAYILDGPLDTSKSGNGQVPISTYPTTGVKKIPHFVGVGSGAGVRHWEQQVPQYGGSCWISFGFYSSTSAQITDLNANGNPGIISAPNEGTGNGLAYGASARYSNVMPMISNMAFLLPHTAYGITYGAFNLYGAANAHVENVSIATLGVVPGSDYGSPGTFGTGLSIAALMPAPGNNDLTIIRNLSIQGGFTYGIFFSEHTVIDRIMVLYCWAALCPVGNYAGSVGAVHPMKILTASVEACAREVYFVGVGSEGVGPRLDIDQLQTESGTPTFDGNSTAALAGAEGRIMLTGLFTPSGVSIAQPSGIELVNGQTPRAIARKAANYAASPIDRTLLMDTTAGGLTLTLPNADYNPVEYVAKNTGTNTLTVAASGGQLIYPTGTATGSSTVAVAAGGFLRVQAVYNGTAWAWYVV